MKKPNTTVASSVRLFDFDLKLAVWLKPHKKRLAASVRTSLFSLYNINMVGPVSTILKHQVIDLK